MPPPPPPVLLLDPVGREVKASLEGEALGADGAGIERVAEGCGCAEGGAGEGVAFTSALEVWVVVAAEGEVEGLKVCESGVEEKGGRSPSSPVLCCVVVGLFSKGIAEGW